MLPLVVATAAQAQGAVDQLQRILPGNGSGKAVQSGYVVRLKIAKAFPEN